MAAQNKLFQRLIWLVDTIYSAKHITREEIDRRWANSRYNDMHSIVLPLNNNYLPTIR